MHRYGLWSKWYIENGVLHTASGKLLCWQRHIALAQVSHLRRIALGPLCLIQLFTPAGVIQLPLVRRAGQPVLVEAWERCAGR